MKKQKKTIKEELEREISALYKGKEEINMYYFVISFIKETLQRFIEETKLKERIYEEEVEKFKIDNSTTEGEFFEQFLDGYNQAIKDIKEKQAKWLKENLPSNSLETKVKNK